MNFERRLWPRHESAVESVVVWLDAETSETAAVLDESQTGLAVLFRDASRLTLDQEVRVDYDGRSLWALVKYLGPEENGLRQVGLQWGSSEFRIADIERLVQEFELAPAPPAVG